MANLLMALLCVTFYIAMCYEEEKSRRTTIK